MRVLQTLLILVSAALIVAFFLPYFKTETSMNTNTSSSISEIKPVESIDVTMKEINNPSMFTFVKVYFQGTDTVLQGSVGSSIFYTILYGIVPVFALLVFIYALCNVPVPALIFSIFIGGLTYAIHWDFVSRRIMENSALTHGIGWYMYFGCAGAMFLLSLFLIIAKHYYKKQRNR